MPCQPYPCGCCNPCQDYYDPNEWYALLCRVDQSTTGYANRFIHAPGERGDESHYWGPNSLHSKLQGLLVNWQFELTEPFYDVGNLKQYASPFISVPSLDDSTDLYIGEYADAEVDYTAYPTTFSDGKVQVIIVDRCDLGRYAIIRVYITITTTGLTLSSPLNHPLPGYTWIWQVRDLAPAYYWACGEEIEGDYALTDNLFYDEVLWSGIPTPIRSPIVGSTPGVVKHAVVDVNTPSISC